MHLPLVARKPYEKSHSLASRVNCVQIAGI